MNAEQKQPGEVRSSEGLGGSHEQRADDPVVGHKTFRDENGSRHELIRASEAAAIMAAVDEAKRRRAELMPTERDAVRAMWEAYHRLEELGWRNATYCPRDGRTLLFIEAGSSGIHEGHCDDPDTAHRRPTVWLHDHGDLWPSQPVLYREPPNVGAEPKPTAEET